MNYGELKAQILAYAHRSDLTDEVAGFVSLAEGLIRRDLRAAVYTVTLDEDDREADGVYTLPVGLTEVRVLRVLDSTRHRTLEQKSLAEVRTLPASVAVQWFAVNGLTVEFRGVPATDAEIELTYFGHPAALSADEDELALDEALDIYGALFHLYKFTQDLELADDALQTFQDALTKLNEAAGRKLGGASVRPAYHFGPVRRGY
jgi:hypothetical protein